MTDVVTLPLADWDRDCSAAERQQAIVALESGNVLLLPQLRFPVAEDERRLLSPAAAAHSKNISLDPASGTLRGSDAGEADLALLRSMMSRFARLSAGLVRNLCPRYAGDLVQARTSYRPAEIAGRSTSWRKDDTRLHVDSFPSTPTQGQRILRVFANVNPQAHTRIWRIGEPFENIAQRFVPSIPKPVWGVSPALNLLGITKSRRSAYDHYMLNLHDQMKRDPAYQAESAQQRFEFPPDTTWLVFTDQASHAAMGGQYALEQTFYLPVESMLDPSKSPLRVLERLLARPLA